MNENDVCNAFWDGVAGELLPFRDWPGLPQHG